MKKTLTIPRVLAALAVMAVAQIALAKLTSWSTKREHRAALVALCEEFTPGMPQEKLEKAILVRYPSATVPLIFSPRRHTLELLAAPVELEPWKSSEDRTGPFLVVKSSRKGATVDSAADGKMLDILVYDDSDFHVSVLILGEWHTLPLPKYKFSAQAYTSDNCAVKS